MGFTSGEILSSSVGGDESSAVSSEFGGSDGFGSSVVSHSTSLAAPSGNKDSFTINNSTSSVGEDSGSTVSEGVSAASGEHKSFTVGGDTSSVGEDSSGMSTSSVKQSYPTVGFAEIEYKNRKE